MIRSRTIRLGRLAAAGAAAAFVLATGANAQKLYKWTDDKGVVHYTDKAPDPGRGGTVLDKQGRQVSRIDAANTPDQARAKEAAEEKQREASKDAELEARRNRALLSSYTTESEIDLARARAAGTVETQIQAAQAYLSQLQKRKKDIDARKARYTDKPVPPQLEAESASVDAEYTKNRDLVAQKQRELAAVNARYESDKERWRELKGQDAAAPGPGRTQAAASPAPSATAKK